MKKILFLSIIFGMLFFSTSNVKAQNVEGESVIGANVGFSMVGAFFGAFTTVNTDEVQFFVTPAFQLSYDYAVTDIISLGLAGSYQNIGVDIMDYQYVNGQGDLITEDYRSSFSRSTIAMRTLFHYGLANDQFDLYSGLRVGMLFRNGKTTSTDPDVDAITDLGLGLWNRRLNTQLILLGARGYVTDNIAINLEFGLGAPHFASLGAAFRF